MQADMKTFTARETYGTSVLTAAVAGNSYEISDQMAMPESFISSQFKAIAADFDIKAFKTGMLTNQATVDVVTENIQNNDFGFFVLDPVIITEHGALLLEESAYQTLIDELIPLSDIITPNFYEAQKLSGVKITNDDDMITAAKVLQKMGASTVFIKGKHDSESQNIVRDLFLDENETVEWFEETYVNTTRVNGSGDTLSSCIVSEVAKGKSVRESVRIAKSYTHEAIKNEMNVGHKFGPVNHIKWQ